MLSGTYRAERKPAGYRQHTVSSTALGLAGFTGGIPKGATYAKVVVETNAIRWRDDGAAATTSVGFLQSASTNNEIELVSSEQIRNFSIIRSASDSVVSVAYYSANPAY
jgi:hypothetical protein